MSYIILENTLTMYVQSAIIMGVVSVHVQNYDGEKENPYYGKRA